ncbi:MAG TPA: Na+/H+ antiporter subunit G [Usitatibacter sp.]|nr:Na+/H+ antiporter subunit G [Usitatibacter sp.]
MSAFAPWIDVVVAILLIASGVLSVAAAVGIVRLPTFFRRLHPPALASTLGAWCVALASILYFTALDGRPSLKALLVNILLAITAPITTALLARAGLFRKRQAGDEVPAPMVRADARED